MHKKRPLKIPASKTLKTSSDAEVEEDIELQEENEGVEEQYYENTAFIGLCLWCHVLDCMHSLSISTSMGVQQLQVFLLARNI